MTRPAPDPPGDRLDDSYRQALVVVITTVAAVGLFLRSIRLLGTAT